MSAAGYPLAPDPSVEWAGATRRYDLVKEAVFALARGHGARARPVRGVLLPRREAGDDRVVGGGRPEGPPRHRGLGAERDERRRHLRAALHPRCRRRTEPDRPPLAPAAHRRPDPGRPAERVRARAALDPGAHRPDPRAGAARVRAGAGGTAPGVGERVREGDRPRARGSGTTSLRATTGRCRR